MSIRFIKANISLIENLRLNSQKVNKSRVLFLKTFLLFIFFVFISLCSVAQQGKTYSFIKDSLNIIQNDSLGMSHFYRLMHGINDSNATVSVVQIGDSHIQADWFSGKIRTDLHKKYPNAGRGLVFPYRVAKTNGPDDIRSSSNVEWECKRIISNNPNLPIGVSGVTIRSTCDTAILRFRLKPTDSIDYRFNTICLYLDKNDSTYDIVVTDTNKRKLAFLKTTGLCDSQCYSKIMLDTLVDEVCFQMVKVDSVQKYTQIYGLELLNGHAGVVYNTIGINGAIFNHYTRNPLFFEQVSQLKPDLVILSLGTNDSFFYLKNLNAFKESVETMIRELRKLNPQVSILFTTPPDANRKRKYKNLNMLKIRNSIIEICNQQKAAYWDLYAIMGGFGSVNKWYAKNLAQGDRIHYTVTGYGLQAKLFNLALQNGLDRFKY